MCVIVCNHQKVGLFEIHTYNPVKQSIRIPFKDSLGYLLVCTLPLPAKIDFYNKIMPVFLRRYCRNILLYLSPFLSVVEIQLNSIKSLFCSAEKDDPSFCEVGITFFHIRLVGVFAFHSCIEMSRLQECIRSSSRQSESELLNIKLYFTVIN